MVTNMPKPGNTSVVEGRYWHKIEDERIQCDLCPRFCRLHNGQRGLCFVRARRNNKIVLTTYGKSSGFCVDPGEKKPRDHFLPGTRILSFGTAGCNLTCKFCQNWDISKSRKMETLADAASPKLIAAAAQKLGCRSVAFTYNDPVIFLEYEIDVVQECHKLNIKAVAVTAGEICVEPRHEFFHYFPLQWIQQMWTSKRSQSASTTRFVAETSCPSYIHCNTSNTEQACGSKLPI